MKKYIVFMFVLYSVSVHAASTGTLILSGVVPVNQSLTIVPTNNTSLNILTGETAKNVATVTEVSNDSNGYKIQASSLTNGFLELSTDSTKKTAYQISYGGGSYITVTNTNVTLKNVSSLSSNTSTDSPVLVNVTALPNAVAGTYNDVLTISIVAN